MTQLEIILTARVAELEAEYANNHLKTDRRPI